MSEALTRTLLARLFESYGKGALEDFLKREKAERDLPRNSLRTSGTAEELTDIVVRAVSDNHVSVQGLRELVDRVEEHGGQHVFLFSLKPRATSAVKKLAGALPALPKNPTDAMYAQQPSQNRIYVAEDSPSRLVLKQIRTAHYWVKDLDESSESDDKQVIVRVRKRRRAINVVLFDLDSGEVEVRVSKVTGEPINQKGLALSLLDDLEARLSPTFSFAGNCEVTKAWTGFREIVKDRSDVYMSVDAAKDPTFHRSLASRREGTKGKDVREAPGYDLDDKRYTRDALSVYWRIPNADERWLHTHITRVKHVDSTDGEWSLAKVYIPAKASPQEVAHVISRIRSAAR